MDIKRLWHSLRLYTIFNSAKRGDYIRKHRLMRHVGSNVRIPTMLLPLYSELISIGDNVEIASGVRLVTHDAIHGVFNNRKIAGKVPRFCENIGCIEIGSNCFVGSGTIILGNIKIGDNVVIGAGSLVNKDIKDNTVCGGVPVKVLCSFEDLMTKRAAVKACEDVETMWDIFYKERQ